MRRYLISLLVPVEKETLAEDLREAGREAVRMAELHNKDSKNLKTIVRSVTEIEYEPEPIDFGFVNGDIL